MIVEIVLFVTVLILTSMLFRKFGDSSNFPPGPTGIPILGYVLFLGNEPQKTLAKLSKKYGDIFSANMGPNRCVFVGKPVHIKEISKRPQFQGRPNLDYFKLWAGHEQTHGILFNEGDNWAEQRHFSVPQLRNLGFGKSSMEDIICHEVSQLLDSLKSKMSEPVEVSELFKIAVLNSIWTLVAGKSYKHNDQFLKELVKLLENDVVDTNFLALFIPALSRMFPKLMGRNKIINALNKLRNLIKKEVEAHKVELDADNPRDFTDVYLKKMKETTDIKLSFYGTKGDHSIVTTMMDLFGAGFETTSTALTWACLYLSYYPRVQTKLQSELDNVIGRERLPTISDRLVYLEATVQEVLRFSAMVPLLPIHRMIEETEFHGFRLPKGTWVIGNAYQASRDPEYWEEPEEFRPERFMGPDGSIKSNEAFLMFGTGNRKCIGEALARLEIKLFLGSILQMFNLSLEPGPMPSLEARSPGITIHPHPFKLILSMRDPSE